MTTEGLSVRRATNPAYWVGSYGDPGVVAPWSAGRLEAVGTDPIDVAYRALRNAASRRGWWEYEIRMRARPQHGGAKGGTTNG